VGGRGANGEGGARSVRMSSGLTCKELLGAGRQ